jgi:hypothetical protein
MEVTSNSSARWQGGPEISFYHYIYKGGFLAPYSVTAVHKVEISVKRLFQSTCHLYYSAYIVSPADSRGEHIRASLPAGATTA